MIFKFDHNEISKAQTKIFEFCQGKKGHFTLEVVKSKNIRSLNQNRYYWGVIVKMIADETGYMMDEVHQILKGEFLRYERDGKTFTRSSSALNTLEFEQYGEKCRLFAAENLGLTIPLPHEITEEMWIELRKGNDY